MSLKLKIKADYSSTDSDSEPTNTKNAFKEIKKKYNSKAQKSEFKTYDRTSDSSPDSLKSKTVIKPVTKFFNSDDDDDDFDYTDKIVINKVNESNRAVNNDADDTKMYDSFDLCDIDTQKRNNTIPRTPSNSSRSLSSELEIDSTSSQLIKVFIDQKPPIDKSKKQRSSSLEKPSNSDSDTLNTSTRSRPQNNDSYVDYSSSNEITDVSPLSSSRKPSISSSLSDTKFKKNIKINNDLTDMSDLMSSLERHVTYNDKNISETKYNKTSSSFNGKFQNVSASQQKQAENEDIIQRLMQSKEKKRSRNEKPVRVTSSALNRLKDQQRIERENKMILKRILSVKPSKFLTKNEQLKDYYKTFGSTTGIVSSTNQKPTSSSLRNDRPSSKSSCLSSQYSGSTISFAQSINSSKASVKSQNMSGRLSGAKSNITLMNNNYRDKTPLNRRPSWDDRW